MCVPVTIEMGFTFKSSLFKVEFFQSIVGQRVDKRHVLDSDLAHYLQAFDMLVRTCQIAQTIVITVRLPTYYLGGKFKTQFLVEHVWFVVGFHGDILSKLNVGLDMLTVLAPLL